MNLISRGLSFVNYSGHGLQLAGFILTLNQLILYNFSNRSMYPFIISNACRTAQFNDTASFGIKMLFRVTKAPIGFIGCTNDSYWDEILSGLWAGTPNDNPKYSETGLGALDRLFHTQRTTFRLGTSLWARSIMQETLQLAQHLRLKRNIIGKRMLY